MGAKGSGKPVLQRGKWRIRWTDESGKRQSATYDRKSDANQALAERDREVEQIQRGEKLRVASDKTFDDLCDEWLVRRAARKRSEKDDQSIIRRHLRPAFGPMKLTALVLRGDVIDDLAEKLEDDHQPKTVRTF